MKVEDMSQHFGSVIALTTVLFSVACGLPYEQDVQEVADRYAFRHKEDCQSWLYSAQTGFRYCASPPVVLATIEDDAPGFEGMDDGPTDLASLSERGEVVYAQLCSTCHQAEGQGMAGQFPPLAGSGDYYGDAQNHAKIIVHGLQGLIVVQGQEYNGVMAEHGSKLTDYDIAAVATYERNSWGNADGIVVPADVAAVR
jgi:nitrite reductase (NO-forming)